ncbi:unnamed protein product, partial [marine sediment metagenome]
MPPVVPGDYHIIVRTDIRNNVRESNETNNSGTSAETIAVDVIELTLGVPYSSQLSTGAEHYYKVTVGAGEDMLVTLDSASTTSANELYVRYEGMPDRGYYDFLYNAPFLPDQEVLVPGTQAGTYYILVRGDAVPDSPAGYTITAQLLEFGIRSLFPTYGGDTGTVTLSISGGKFEEGISALLRIAGHPEIHAERVDLENSTTLWARFDLNQAPLGAYDLLLTNPDGSSALGSGIFT